MLGALESQSLGPGSVLRMEVCFSFLAQLSGSPAHQAITLDKSLSSHFSLCTASRCWLICQPFTDSYPNFVPGVYIHA